MTKNKFAQFFWDTVYIQKKFKTANWQCLNRSRVSNKSRVSNSSRGQKWHVLIEAGDPGFPASSRSFTVSIPAIFHSTPLSQTPQLISVNRTTNNKNHPQLENNCKTSHSTSDINNLYLTIHSFYDTYSSSISQTPTQCRHQNPVNVSIHHSLSQREQNHK